MTPTVAGRSLMTLTDLIGDSKFVQTSRTAVCTMARVIPFFDVPSGVQIKRQARTSSQERLRRFELLERRSPQRAELIDRLLTQFLGEAPRSPTAAPGPVEILVSLDRLNRCERR